MNITGNGEALRADAAAVPDGVFGASMDAFRRDFERDLRLWIEGRTAHLGSLVPEAGELAEAVRDLLLAGGKRLRPALIRCGHRAAAAPDSAALGHLCLAIECLHAYLLIHDDIMDRAETRRGLPAAHVRFRRLHRARGWAGQGEHYGDSCGILAGDLAASWATEALGEAVLGLPRERAAAIHGRFHRMMDEVIAGQHLEMRVAARGRAEDGELLRILRLKSGAYSVERPLELGAVLGGASPEVLDCLAKAGRDLGEAFQLRDDLLGLFGDPGVTGKPVGGDLSEGKITWVIQEALRAASPDGQALLESALGAPLDPERTGRVIELLRATGAESKAESMIRERTRRAQAVLESGPLPREPREFLLALAADLEGPAGLPEPAPATVPAAPRDRKAEHIAHAMDPAHQAAANAFDAWRLEHEALPELDYAALDLSTPFLGRTLRAPLLISCMTGGTSRARRINRNLAAAAEACGVALGVGSQRRAIEDPSLAATFQVRDLIPTMPLLANLGAVQLNYGYGLDECRRAVDMIQADALVLHLNPLQECIQPEGQRNFSGLLRKIGSIARNLGVPVVCKEVGNGISPRTAKRLLAEGVAIVDVAGYGGTSFARIEGARAAGASQGERFGDWGIPTPEALLALRDLPGLTVIGSGGIRDGLDAAKAIALGAAVAAAAYPYLGPALQSSSLVIAEIERMIEGLKISMLCTGARDVPSLGQVPIRRKADP